MSDKWIRLTAFPKIENNQRSGLLYIRESYPNIYGVGFDRVEEKAKRALGT